MAKTYKTYLPEQDLLLPPSLRDWLPENHLAYCVSDVVDQLECAGINRREVANERVVQVRRSEPTWPRVMRGQSQGCT
jgi:hypothetical protein